ncbi:copper amine oxidase N-terminal domain-containing protein [Paenibacillus naphthalenovorans]|uniref:copper amine oxidase N-terminal domain-containing protein n=1 Tax=Paenibacillus naphthalenovorans TaxID=162209 RepID=UPI0008804869|nr:copper amine oxidase N-terminal domain-containing protein [Paenibacillus naphthalenovorans]SDJ87036.1 Copper amine oxidase N-terminal domain-containing protein [Paenibacillus naphthalenovorans]
MQAETVETGTVKACRNRGEQYILYKLIPTNRKYVEINGYEDAAKSMLEIEKALNRYKGETVEGTTVIGNVKREKINNRTMVSLREISDIIGGEISWDGANQTISFIHNDKNYTFKINSSAVLKNGTETIHLDEVAQFIKDGATYIPLSFIVEELAVKTEWNEAEGLIQILK